MTVYMWGLDSYWISLGSDLPKPVQERMDKYGIERFSSKYATFEDWQEDHFEEYEKARKRAKNRRTEKQKQTIAYYRRIVNAHERDPTRTLKGARGKAKKVEPVANPSQITGGTRFEREDITFDVILDFLKRNAEDRGLVSKFGEIGEPKHQDWIRYTIIKAPPQADSWKVGQPDTQEQESEELWHFATNIIGMPLTEGYTALVDQFVQMVDTLSSIRAVVLYNLGFKFYGNESE